MKIKNLKINRKLATLLLAGAITIGATSGHFIKDNTLLANKTDSTDIVNVYVDDNFGTIATSIPENTIQNVYGYNDEWDLVVYKNSIGFVYHSHIDDIEHDEKAVINELDGTVTTTAKLNFRLGPSTKYKSMKVLSKNATAEVLGITSNNWYIIRINGEIGYVSGNYVRYTPSDKVYESENEIQKFCQTNVAVNFRKGPGTNSDKMCVLPKGTQLECLEYLENNWYRVKYNNQIGYVFGDYITFNLQVTKPTESKEIEPLGEYRTDIKKVIYATESINLRNEMRFDAESLYVISKYEACEVLEETTDWYKVRCAGLTGYISKRFTSELSNVFVVVDISEQKLTLYNNNVIILETDIVSGTKGKHDTPIGLYSIQSKTKDTYLRGRGYCSHVDFWMPFYYGYGLHDADWRSSFGKTYYETSGSHGCVNIPPEVTEGVYNNVEVGTKVLVHK